MGPLPKWVDLDEAHDLTAKSLVPTKKTGEMVMILIDRYSDVCDVEDILRKAKRKHRGS
jgi:hypothetical protein